MLKSLISGSRKHFTAMNFTLFLFGVFAMVWFYGLNRYTILYYQEQIQLFRFDRFYFLSFLERPGGLSEYFGAFLTQFYFYPFVGAVILTAILIAVVLLFYHICRSCGNIRQLFFIPFIPAVLLMTSFTNIFFDMPAALGILLALAGFSLYIAISLPVRYGVGILLVTVTYFIAGGNALLFASLILIFELTFNRTQITQISANNANKNPRKSALSASSAFKTLYLFLLVSWTALLPWLSMHLFYIVTMREAYFALTPVTFIIPIFYNKLLWLSIPVLFLVWRLVAGKIKPWKSSLRKIDILNFLMVFAITVYCAYTMYDRKNNTINRMTYELQHHNFDSAIAIAQNYPPDNRLGCYFTNIALYESGQMPYRMFHYRQMGTAGLFLNWEFANNNVLVWYLGETYYRLGMILQAEHCAFESLVSNPKGADVKVLQRLVLTNIERRDSATANKYLQYLDHSLFYRKWAQQQRANLASAMADSTFHIPEMPMRAHCENFFIPYQMPEYTLLSLLKSNPKNRMAFEYMMAYCMLQKDLEKVKWCMDNYYHNFDYPSIPTHYEEALVLYKIAIDKDPGLFTKYPISDATQERYNRYMQAVNVARGGEHKFEQFRKRFDNTYWFYMNLH